jgi:ferric-dicitrate binding protein FerR (iron transport regulator)
MRSFVMPVLGLAALSIAGPVAALEASGQVIAVVRDTAASGPAGDRALAVKGPVYSGDLIKTNRRGTTQILFADNTRMVIGPNSEVAVDDFVFSGSSKASTFAIDALRGSFRFITGASAKNVYSINTPTATIGVRGTAFDGHVAEDGTTTIAMWRGTVRLCDKTVPRHCTEISGKCGMIQVDPQENFNRVNDVYKRTDILDRLVPFAFRQARLFREFRVSSSSCAIRNLDPPSREQGERITPTTTPDPPPEPVLD